MEVGKVANIPDVSWLVPAVNSFFILKMRHPCHKCNRFMAPLKGHATMCDFR